MPTIKNNGKLNYLHIGLRIAVLAIAGLYEKANGTRNSENKLFVEVSPADDLEYLNGIRSKDEKEKAAAKKGIKSVAIALIENGKKDFKHPYLQSLILEIIGNKAKKMFANLEWADGCLVIDGGKPFKPAKQADEPQPEADKEEEQYDEPQPVKKTRKRKGDDENPEAGQA
jgi:hypothetical protein